MAEPGMLTVSAGNMPAAVRQAHSNCCSAISRGVGDGRSKRAIVARCSRADSSSRSR